jgi:hypothetical protein
MTNHFSRRIITDVLVILISVVIITIAATPLAAPIRSSIADYIPPVFHAKARPLTAAAVPATPERRTTNLVRAQSGCRLRSAPLQWNVDWFFRPPVARG